MSVYRVRWVCPVTTVAKAREFHSKGEADAFAALPRSVPAAVKRMPG